MLESLLLLKENWAKFDQFTIGQEKDIIEQLIGLIKNNNRKVKETASDALESYIETLSAREGAAHRDLIHYFVAKVKYIINHEEDPVEVMVCIRCFGHLACLIKRCLGQEELHKHFLLLFEISQNRVLDDITDSYKNVDYDSVQPENFKKILYRQKQLNSHIKAFALIVREMDTISEAHAKHLLDLFMIGVKKHKLFFEGYKKYLYIALVQLICSLAAHPILYKFWAKKAINEMLNAFVEMPTEGRELYDQDINAIKSAGEFIVRLLKQEQWIPEVKTDFIKGFMTSFTEFLSNSEFGYEEITDQGKKLYIPNKAEDQHLTLRLALIFEEVQRQEILDEVLPEHYTDILSLTSKEMHKFPRTSSLQKIFKSLLSAAERKSESLLVNIPENMETIESLSESQFLLLRELRGDILLDNLRCLLNIPSILLRQSSKLMEVFRRALLITLETSGPNCLFMIDHAVTNLERVLVKEKVDMREGRDNFLQDVLPYFAGLLDLEIGGKSDNSWTLTVQESYLEKETVLRKSISFLGSLGSDLHYIAKGRAKENELEQAEGDALKISIPINKHRISLNLNHVIKRASQLALESTNEEVQSAASELFHGSVVVLIGKCSQGNQAGEDFVEALESSLPNIVKMAINSNRFAPLFKLLLFQVARWLALNKEEENPLVSSFIGGVLDLAGCGDKPEVRSLCLEALENFLTSTYKFHTRFEYQVRNYGIFFRKVETLTLHPDAFRRLAGLMSLKLVVSQLTQSEALLKHLFFEVIFYFFLFVRKQEQKEGDTLSDDTQQFCEEIFTQVEILLKTRADKLDTTENDSAKFTSINDLFQTLQKSLFSPEPSLRDYSLRLWLLIRQSLPSHLSTSTLKQALSFLEDSMTARPDDPFLASRALIARCASLSTLIEGGVLVERHLRESGLWPEVVGAVERLVGASIGEDETGPAADVRREGVIRVVQLAGLMRSEEKEILLRPVRSPGLVKSVVAAAFNRRSVKNTKSVELCKKVLTVLSVDIPGAIKEFVNSHEYRFDSGRDPIYAPTRRIPIKSLEAFFSTILQFLSPDEVKHHLLNSVRIYHMLKFVKNARKNSSADYISRAKVFLQFLLNTRALEDSQIAEFLDPFNPSFDHFVNLVQSHISKMPEQETQGLVRYLFIQCRKDHNIFSSIVELLSLFVQNERKTDAFFDSFNETFDPGFIKSHDLFLKNILNLGIIFLQENRKLSDLQSTAVLEQALSKQNKDTLGLLALDFLSHYARASPYEQMLIMYRKVRGLLVDYSRDVLPVIYEDNVVKSRESEMVTTFATRVFELIRSSLMLEPFEVVFPLIRNKKRFRGELSGIIEAVVSPNRYDLLMNNVQFCLGIYRDRGLSDSLEFNIRFTIIDRVLLPLLESVSEEHLRELIIEIFPELEKILTPDISIDLPARQRVLAAGEKACAYRILELFFRKITPHGIKEIIHPRIVGPQTQKNELTKKIILFCTNTKKLKRTLFEDAVTKDLESGGHSAVQFGQSIIMDYYCSAYNCLVSVLLNTQTKEGPFTKFLLSSDPLKGDILFDNFVDIKFNYGFKVTTNFVSENLQDYYKSENTNEFIQRAGVRQFVAKLTADSLFTQTLNRGRLAPDGLDGTLTQRQQLLNLLNSQEPQEYGSANKGMDIERPKEEDSKLEMDPVNQHPIMKAFLRLIDHLDSNFKITEGPETIPGWISLIYRLFVDHTELNQRIFLIKVLLNRPSMFRPYRDQFNQFLLEYLGQANNGGSGLHYFLRDVCTTLITWNSDSEVIPLKAGPALLKRLCYDGVRNLCKKLADESKPIFVLNVDIFQRLCHLMKKVLIVDAGLVFNMLTYEEKKQDTNVEADKNKLKSSELTNAAVLWRLTAISILETCVYEGIELGSFETSGAGAAAGSGGSNDQTISQTFSYTRPVTATQSDPMPFNSSISMDIETDGKILIFHEKILVAVLANMRIKKKVLSSAAFRVAGIYLNYLSGRLPFSHNIFEQVKQQVLKEIESLMHKDIKNFEVNICELCKVFPDISLQDIILIQLTSYVIKTTGKTRGYIFNSLRTIFHRCLEKPEQMERVASELILTLLSSLEKILRDSDPNNIREFVLLLTEAAKLKSKEIVNFLESCLGKICEKILKLLKPEDSGFFFDFIVLLHENYAKIPGIFSNVKKYMILGLASSDECVRKLFIDYLNSDSKTMSTEEGVLTFILRDLYNPEFEHHWLTTSAQMVLSLSKNSSQADELIFDRPLAGYVSYGLLTFPTRANLTSQMSQPLIPLSLVAASQVESKQISAEKHSATQDNQEKLMKLKMKYAEQESTDEKVNNILTDEPVSALFNQWDSASAISKMSIKLVNKTLQTHIRPQRNEGYLKDFRSFLRQNQLSFNQVSQTDDNKLRILDQIGTKVKKPDPRTFTTQKMDFSSSNLRTLREYRQGELPDIQIKYSDLLKPLTVLASQDARMAQLIFVPLFIEVHQKQPAVTNTAIFRYLLKIIDQSQSNFQVINTVQAILYELSLHAQSLEIDPALIAKTGTGSLSFGGAALLLEDMLAKLQRGPKRGEIEKETTRVNGPTHKNDYEDDEKFGVEIKGDPESVNLVLNLVEIYKQMNEDDILRGLYRLLHADDKAANDVFDLKMGKKTQLSLKKLEEMIADHTQDRSLYNSYLSQEKRENLYYLNRWDDLVKDVMRDPEYSTAFQQKEGDVFLISDIARLKKNDRYVLLRGLLNNDTYWETFRESAEFLMTDYTQKVLLEKDHPYELSLLSITMQEFDRAKFYLEKFRDKFLKNWSSVKDFSGFQTKTEVVSELLRQHELKDFLVNTRHYNVEGMIGSPDLDRFFDTLNGWLKKRSATTLDNFNYLSDSYHSRCLFIDIMKNRYQEYTEDLYIKHHVKVSMEYTKGLLKMGYVDTAERVVNKAFQQKGKFLADDNSLDYDLANLMVRTKLEGIDRDINFISRVMDESNINLKFINTRFTKVNQLMDYWMSKKVNESDFVEGLKFTLLRLKTKSKEIAVIRDYLGPNQTSNEVESQYLKIVSDSLPLVNSKIESLQQRQNLQALMDIEDDNYVEIRGKILRKGCDITENVLRWYKSKGEAQEITLKQMAELEPASQILGTAKQLIHYTAALVSLGIVIPSRILFVLEVTAEFSDDLGHYFYESFEKAPCWVFLKWLPQIMSYLNFESGSCFLWIIERLMLKFPEPLIYALSVTTDYSTTFRQPNSNFIRLREMLEKHFGVESTHRKFIRAMECLLHPDQRLKSWLDALEENVGKLDRLKLLRERMIADLFSTLDEYVGDGIGEFNKKFIKEMEKHIHRLFGSGFANLEKMSREEMNKAAQELYTKADNFSRAKSISVTTSSYKTKLTAFSGWLGEYDINNYRRHDLRIEIPGQYSGDKEPIPDLHVKVSYFMPEILVIQSIRKPKRLTMLGTDEKVYHCLVKGGEDLRLDQRIEQLFSLMNEVFTKDSDCYKREFSIGTFNVVPVKKNLGVMEWVKNTVPLKSVIEKEMSPNEDILNNNAYIKRAGLLKQLAKGKDIREQHLALLGAKRETIVKEFNNQLKYFKSTYLKIAIKKKVQNAEQFVKLRKSFVSNYAILSLSSYILGVGDRHLDNFLFDYINGRIIPIDFGYSFGFGVGLYIPELMPFRMTQNFQELTYPLGIQGLFRNSMIFGLKALKDNRHLLTDTCEVFIRDPLIDWIKIAKSKTINKSSQAIEEEMNVYPRDKLKIVQMKLAGQNPVTIMLKELEKTRHFGQPYYNQLVATVKGDRHRSRATMITGVLPLCDQVDALIDMAIDPDILGRTWSGWAPYA